MNLDLDDLDAQAARAAPPRPVGTARVVYDLRRRQELRGWITMETVALAPVPHRLPDGVSLTSLLVVEDERSTEQVRYRPAWGALVWSWPELEIRHRLTLDQVTDPAKVERIARFRTPGTGWVAPVPRATAPVLHQLFPSLDEALEAGWPPPAEELHRLGALYREILPVDAIRLLRVLVPDVGDWLTDRPLDDSDATGVDETEDD